MYYEEGKLKCDMSINYAVCSLANHRDICKIEYTTKKKKIQTINGAFNPPENCPYILEHTVSPELRPDYFSYNTYPIYL
jgi:hypothetical protein